MKKGLTFIWYMMLVLSFAIIMLIFLTVGHSSVKFFIGSAVKNDANLRARDISGIINSMESGPDYVKVVYYLPKGKCVVNITNMSVHVKVPSSIPGLSQDARKFFIQDKCIKINPANFTCSENNYKEIHFYKVCNNIVVVEGHNTPNIGKLCQEGEFC